MTLAVRFGSDRHMSGFLLLWLLFLPLYSLTLQADEESEPDNRILVTFVNDAGARSAARPAPGRIYRYRSRYVVSVTARANAQAIAADYDMRSIDEWPIKSLGIFCVVYEIADPEAIQRLIDRLGRDPRIESVQQMNEFHGMTTVAATYNDAYVGLQHGLESMGVSQAHIFANGEGVTIAVVDTGIDLQHEDLSGRKIKARSFLGDNPEAHPSMHGTAVVSLIAANPNNHKGIVGVAPEAELVALNACWSGDNPETAQCNSFTLAKALDYIIETPPDLINLSIAGPYDALLGRLIAKARSKGSVVVAARPSAESKEKVYPAHYPGVLAVAAAPAVVQGHSRTTIADGLLAPGVQIMVALPDNDYDFRSGSSLAAANATGVIALLLQHAPGLDGDSVAELLKNSQSSHTPGSKVINACRALAEISVGVTCQ